MKRRVPDNVRIPVRVVEYRITNRDAHETIRLITTLLDPAECPATQLAALYAERWEFEIGLDEVETHQIAGNRVLRSKKPELVEQEIWALLLTHYAIRHLMHEAADDVGIDEDRLSFIRSLRVVRRTIVNDADFPP
jgi:IS4 transposase